MKLRFELAEPDLTPVSVSPLPPLSVRCLARLEAIVVRLRVDGCVGEIARKERERFPDRHRRVRPPPQTPRRQPHSPPAHTEGQTPRSTPSTLVSLSQATEAYADHEASCGR
jgi:hypothetical protein